ncbi:hypothetical protein BC938DRAFT_471511 [Jimgerdemannia flammicorona]|uniref:Uncharacterized protein n=1 Tax=Jimgerdemannia flammicorona TaxID=994334 RepID=A0A433QUT5_9FUNG|nr:hypothetical protein BC938DRAFT_471511 [Jimgerdemannia flammicorona]
MFHVRFVLLLNIVSTTVTGFPILLPADIRSIAPLFSIVVPSAALTSYTGLTTGFLSPTSSTGLPTDFFTPTSSTGLPTGLPSPTSSTGLPTGFTSTSSTGLPIGFHTPTSSTGFPTGFPTPTSSTGLPSFPVFTSTALALSAGFPADFDGLPGGLFASSHHCCSLTTGCTLLLNSTSSSFGSISRNTIVPGSDVDSGLGTTWYFSPCGITTNELCLCRCSGGFGGAGGIIVNDETESWSALRYVLLRTTDVVPFLDIEGLSFCPVVYGSTPRLGVVMLRNKNVKNDSFTAAAEGPGSGEALPNVNPVIDWNEAFCVGAYGSAPRAGGVFLLRNEKNPFGEDDVVGEDIVSSYAVGDCRGVPDEAINGWNTSSLWSPRNGRF